MQDHENLVTVGIGAAWGQLEPHRSVFLAVGGREGLQCGTDPRLPPHHHHPFPTTPPNTHQLEGMLNAELQLAVELLGGSWWALSGDFTVNTKAGGLSYVRNLRLNPMVNTYPCSQPPSLTTSINSRSHPATGRL